MEHRIEMTHAERILAAIEKKETDYSPCLIYYNALYKETRGNRPFNFPWGENATRNDIVRYNLEKFDLPQIIDFGIPLRKQHKNVTVRKWKDKNLLHKQYNTPAGTVEAVVEYNSYWAHGEDIPLGTDWTAHYKKAWVENEQDLECIRYLFMPWEPEKDEYKKLKESFIITKEYANSYHLPVAVTGGKGLTLGLQMFLPEKLCLKTIENPELVHAFLDMEHKCNMKTIEIAGDLGVDIIKRNGFYETSDFYSPKMIEEFLLDRLNEEAEITHEGGMKMVYTLHTGIMPMMDYINKLNIDCIFGIDIAFPRVNLNTIRDKIFHKKSLFIGPSSTYHLWNPDPQVTRKAVREVYDTLGTRGVILGPCVSMHSIMPWDNLLAMIDEWRKCR